MKKLNIIMIMLISSFVFMGCEKEENSLKKPEFEIENKKASTQEASKSYQIYSCAYQGEYTGIKCVESTEYNCPEAADCQPILNNEGEPMPIPEIQATFGFTDEQMSAWEDGENFFEPTLSFVEEYYDFYLHTYNMGVSLHPDEIIENMEEN